MGKKSKRQNRASRGSGRAASEARTTISIGDLNAINEYGVAYLHTDTSAFQLANETSLWMGRIRMKLKVTTLPRGFNVASDGRSITTTSGAQMMGDVWACYISNLSASQALHDPSQSCPFGPADAWRLMTTSGVTALADADDVHGLASGGIGTVGFFKQLFDGPKFNHWLKMNGLASALLWPYGCSEVRDDDQALWLKTGHEEMEKTLMRQFRSRYEAAFDAMLEYQARGGPFPANIPRLAVVCPPNENTQALEKALCNLLFKSYILEGEEDFVRLQEADELAIASLCEEMAAVVPTENGPSDYNSQTRASSTSEISSSKWLNTEGRDIASSTSMTVGDLQQNWSDSYLDLDGEVAVSNGTDIVALTTAELHQKLQQAGLRICRLFPTFGDGVVEPEDQLLWLRSDNDAMTHKTMGNFRRRYPTLFEAIAHDRPLPKPLPRIAVVAPLNATYPELMERANSLAIFISIFMSEEDDNPTQTSFSTERANSEGASQASIEKKPEAKNAVTTIPLDQLQALQGLPPEQQRERIAALQSAAPSAQTVDEQVETADEQAQGEQEEELQAIQSSKTSDEALCQICGEVPRKLAKLWCGHSFCRPCIMKHAKKKSQYCPECGSDLCWDLHFPVSIPPRGYADKDVCHWCRKEGPRRSMKCCEICEDAGDLTTYCSLDCRYAAWQVHKKSASAHWEARD